MMPASNGIQKKQRVLRIIGDTSSACALLRRVCPVLYDRMLCKIILDLLLSPTYRISMPITEIHVHWNYKCESRVKKGIEKQRNIAENVSVWQTKLISLYCAVCDNSSVIKREMQRQSNNFRPQFTDEECITVYLWGISQRRFEQKAIYNYTKNHLSEWFPKLPRYQAFSRRCAALAPAFRALAEQWMEQAAPSGEAQTIYMVDSCPIMLAHRSRSGYAKVAGDLCAKSYNSTRKEWYYGVKLHAFTQKRTAKLPVPAALSVSCADVHDLTAAKQMTSECAFLHPGWLYCDKAYIDADWKETLEKEYGVQIQTPRKKQCGDTLFTGDTMSTFVSSVRQPIESFFNWLSDLTNIQAASKVRSSQGLLLHIFGRVVLLCLPFYSENSTLDSHYNSYSVCPRCKATMEREYQSFCDRCGQRLDWSKYENAEVVYTGWNGPAANEDDKQERGIQFAEHSDKSVYSS